MDKYSAAYVDLSNVRELVKWEGKVCSGRSGHDRNSSDGSATCNSYMTRKNYHLDKLNICWHTLVGAKGSKTKWYHRDLKKKRILVLGIWKF